LSLYELGKTVASMLHIYNIKEVAPPWREMTNQPHDSIRHTTTNWILVKLV
jgi:hypothetical protein